MSSANTFSVIVPACNEENYLPNTLASIKGACTFAPEQKIEIIVVDNASTDRTAAIAAAAGARVVSEPLRNVARARNRGAADATGAILVFVDADTIVPPNLFQAIGDAVAGARCIGGAADTFNDSNRLVIRLYLRFWRVVGTMFGLAQGATQFCTREAFAAVGGYDESLWMGEDVDFYSRLKKFATGTNSRVQFLRDVQVRPSSRRFDRWPVWEILLRTNPLYILVFRRRRNSWKGWYDQLIR